MTPISIMAAGIDQLADRHLSQGRALAKLADLSHNLAKVLLLTSVGWNQFSNRHPPPGDPDRLALRDFFQQAVEMGLRVEDSDSDSERHVN
jgi:hypothetical protein